MWWTSISNADFNGGSWQPFREFHEQLNKLVEGTLCEYGGMAPKLNVWGTSDHIYVTAELPGLKSEDLDVSVNGKTLTIKGVRKAEPLKEGEQRLREELSYGDFNRSVELPFLVNAESIEAEYKNGILKISLPRSEGDKARKIKIK